MDHITHGYTLQGFGQTENRLIDQLVKCHQWRLYTITFKNSSMSFTCMMKYIANGSSVHLMKSLAYEIDAIFLKSSVENSITNGGNDACSH